jgi:hypothetical protein
MKASQIVAMLEKALYERALDPDQHFSFAANICPCGCNRRRVGISGDGDRHACANIEVDLDRQATEAAIEDIVARYCGGKACVH